MTTPSLRLLMTDAGRARFTAAQLAGAGAQLEVATVGLTDAAFVQAPTLTALPGEFRRIDTVSGRQVGADIAHLVVRDDAALAYSVRGVGLYLADGTLFGVYGQATPILGKSAVSSLLIALDIAFPALNTVALTFGDTDWLNPPATEDTPGVVELATDAEIDTGADTRRAITPRGLKARLTKVLDAYVSTARLTEVLGAYVLTNRLGEILAGYVGTARRVVGSGLATGGGDLTIDRAIDVPAASAAEVDAGAATNKAVTPASLSNVLAAILARVPLARRVDTSGLALGGNALTTDITISVPIATREQVRIGGSNNSAVTPSALAGLTDSFAATGEYQVGPGVFHKVGTTMGPFPEGPVPVAFATAFPTECRGVFVTGINGSGSALRDIYMQRQSMSAAGFTAYVQKAGSDGSNIDGFDWLAIGR